jgi:hypothetical protein
MREIYQSGVTPQQKLVGVNNKFGNTGIKDQQGTSRIIYDSLLYNTSASTQTFRFFEDSASRNFPLTNTGSDGNKLGVGDTMVIQSIGIYYFFVDRTTKEITWGAPLINAQRYFNLSLINFEIANNKVIKKVTLTETNRAYNKNTSTDNNVIVLETQIVLPPLLPYILELQVPLAGSITPPANNDVYLQAQIIGTGGIIAPRTTF